MIDANVSNVHAAMEFDDIITMNLLDNVLMGLTEYELKSVDLSGFKK